MSGTVHYSQMAGGATTHIDMLIRKEVIYGALCPSLLVVQEMSTIKKTCA